MDFMATAFCREEETQVVHPKGGPRSESVLFSKCNSLGVPNRQLCQISTDEDGLGTPTVLPPEMEFGNIEYKVQLLNPSPLRLQHLITQLKWRLREGQGEAVYELGVEDGGRIAGLDDVQYEASIRTMQLMADSLDASIVVLNERELTTEPDARRRVVELLVRRVPESQQFIELRLAMLGGPDVGKSTLCGVLTQGELDDGQGKCRQGLFRYLHEMQSGKTSSICRDVVGFDARGKLVNYANHSLEELLERSSKVVALFDLAGDSKFLKTTISGLSGYCPHACCLLVSATTGPTAATREHLGLALALSIPFFIVVTKIDAVDRQERANVTCALKTLLTRASPSTQCIRVKNKKMAIKAANALQSVVPILTVSCVTGENLRLLRDFLHVVPARSNMDELRTKEPRFLVDELFDVSHVGTVAAGLLTEGTLWEGAAVEIGPTRQGEWIQAKVESLRRNRQPVQAVRAGEAASVALAFEKGQQEELRKGMVLIAAGLVATRPTVCAGFRARVFLLYHQQSRLAVGSQVTVFIGAVCQSARLVAVFGKDEQHQEVQDPEGLRLAEWRDVQFQFVTQPEVLAEAAPVIFRAGRTKGMGSVTALVPMNTTTSINNNNDAGKQKQEGN